MNSIKKHIYLLIGLLILTIFPMLIIQGYQASILNSVRAYVAGEGHWSKSQKDATHELEHYAKTHDERFYEKFLLFMAVPLGDKRARLALQSQPPKINQAMDGFLDGHNHPDDIELLIELFLIFSKTELMSEPIAIWTEGDVLIEKTIKIAADLRSEINSGAPSQSAVEKKLSELHLLYDQLNNVEDRFSAALGAAAHTVNDYATVIQFSFALFLFLFGSFLVWKIMNGVSRAYEKVARSEFELRQAQEIGHIGSFSIDMQGHLRCSQEGYRILKVSPDSFMPSIKSWMKLVYPDDRLAVTEWIKEGLKGESHGQTTFRMYHPDRSVRTLWVKCNFVHNATSPSTQLTGVFQDVTEQLLIEEKTRQGQKMEALGTLVGGVAHNINNILAGITGNIYLTKMMSKELPDVTKKLDTIAQLSTRMATLIRQLLTFAHKERIDTKPLRFTPVVQRAIHSLLPTALDKVDLDTEMGNDLLIINGDEKQLEQAIICIVNNALDAVESVERPMIHIKLTKFEARSDFTQAHPTCKEGFYVHLSVQDNGCGIPKEDLDKLYDPFFTTKEQGKGVGLGLSMALGAIETHFGAIDAVSHVNKGTTFHVYLPLMNDDENNQNNGNLASN